jgi:glycosyltransferase involved in cell wall biosynthesis
MKCCGIVVLSSLVFITVAQDYQDYKGLDSLAETAVLFRTIPFKEYEPYLPVISKFKNFLPRRTRLAGKKYPRVSIITSVYKGDEFIKGYLEDITRQTIFKQCELIVINAKSPGNEEPIIRKYMQKFPNIKYVKLSKDPGLYGVWDIAIKMALSDFITNSNIDDRRAVNSLEIHAQMLEKNPHIDLVYAPFYGTKIANQTFENRKPFHLYDYPDFSRQNMEACLPGIQPMWRRSLHERYGLFNPWFTSAGDWEMWLRAVRNGAKFKKINQPLGLYYHNPTGLSNDQKAARVKRREIEMAVIRYSYQKLWSK